ncbi:glycoside hydrolase family 36 protein [Vibrio sinensis]|uniref:glycoside hydrolase family 36 protein n=1 Tax=Vibrio sinensis TaxID=2302434 RepID=UPI001A9CD47C|nr:glycosyl hydrolase [Vibrio sinensis]
MLSTISLACRVELHFDASQLSIQTSPDNDEVRFCYRGLANDPIPQQYPLFDIDYDFEHEAYLYGDGYQMLSQTLGTPLTPVDVGRFADNSPSYRIYSSNAPKRFYNYLVISDSLGFTLFGFTSCHRFAGYFELDLSDGRSRLMAYLDGEDTCPQDWATTILESVTVLKGRNLNQLWQRYADLIEIHHPKKLALEARIPAGWSSWHVYNDDITQDKIAQNLRVMSRLNDSLEYVLIDDGYQAAMGDWLLTAPCYGRDTQYTQDIQETDCAQNDRDGREESDVKGIEGIRTTIEQIKQMGKKPAVGVSPFIAQSESQIFQSHPEWFVRDVNARLLRAEDVTYAGWRNTPWYVLDTSNTEVQEHLTRFIRVMREEWGVELFKLNACYWGALKGERFQSGITGIQAYRLGLKAIAQGAGDALLLASHAPLWPSLGLVDIMRISDDVMRDERRFEQTAKEIFLRSWQHNRLWMIDPDSATLVSLPNQATERKYYEFHRDVLLASGGVLLSGDPLMELTSFAKLSLEKLLVRQKYNQETSKFSSLNLNHAFLRLTASNDLHCIFNYQQPARDVTLTAAHPVDWFDYWSGEKLNHELTQAIEIGLETGLSSRAIITVG